MAIADAVFVLNEIAAGRTPERSLLVALDNPAGCRPNGLHLLPTAF